MNARLLYSFLLCAATLVATAQNTNFDGFNYQAVIRDAAGEPLPDQNVTIRFDIRDIPWGPTVYREDHSTTTDANGQVSLVMGNGTPVLGVFSQIDWSNPTANSFSVGVDITGGNNLVELPGVAFKAVPFAMHALSAKPWSYTSGTNTIFSDAGMKVGVGTSSPATDMQIGSYVGAVDRYLTVATQGGNTQRSGIRLRHYDTNYGFTIESDARLATGGSGLNILRHFNDAEGISAVFVQQGTGHVGIGTTTPQSRLAVNGKITSKEVDVTVAGFPDYVFREGYDLMPLKEVDAYIKVHGRLPKMPSEEEVLANGLSLGALNVLLVEKVEELTLLMIEQERTMDAMRTELDALIQTAPKKVVR